MSPNCAEEVRLVSEVKKCQKCQWFWGGNPPFGPYPSFDWLTTFPQEFRQEHEGGQSLMQVRATGCKTVEPAIMHGCRKAPIMTMGINPNLSPYFVDRNYAARAYPNFEHLANYAYHYRYQTIYQECFGLQYIKDHEIANSVVIAEKDGEMLLVERPSNHRWLEMTLQYAGEEQPRKLEYAWTPEARYVILKGQKQGKIPGDYKFRQGEKLAFRFSLPGEDIQSIYSYPVPYYQRILPSLKILAELLQSAQPAGTNVKLKVGEDVSQHDMVACASPGWVEKFDMPVKRIEANCVTDQAFALRQLIQSRPAVLLLVGGSAVEMFCQQLKGWHDLDYQHGNNQTKDSHHLLKETCSRKKYLKIDIGNYHWHCLLVAVPHFSYSDNYRTNCRFSAPAWAAFQSEFPDDVKVLEEKLAEDPKKEFITELFDKVTELKITGNNDPIRSKLSQAAWDIMMANFYEPHKMIADALVSEVGVSLHYNADTGRLMRSEGSCSFCNNELWQFADTGCPYGKDREQLPEPAYLEQIVAQIKKGKVS